MSANSTQLKNALSALNIPVGEQIHFVSVAQSLGIIPKKFLNGKETKQLLKEGSQKYKEFVANEVFKRYNLALEAQKEREAIKEKESQIVGGGKKKTKKVVQREIVGKETVYQRGDTIEDIQQELEEIEELEEVEKLEHTIEEEKAGLTPLA